MFWNKSIVGAVLLAGVTTGNVGWADVTAQQVWNDWKAYLEDFGYQVTAQETKTGGVLTLTDITMTMQAEDAQQSTTAVIPQIVFAELGNGAVSMGMPRRSELAFTVKVEDEVDAKGIIVLSQEGFNTTVTGEIGDLVFDMKADRFDMSVQDMVVDGKPIDFGAAKVSFLDSEGRSTMQVGNKRLFEQSVTAAKITYDLEFTDPDDANGKIKMMGSADGFEMSSNGTLPVQVSNANNLSAMLAAGLQLDFNMGYATSESQFEFTESADTLTGQSSSRGGALTVNMQPEHVQYSGESSGITSTFTGSQMPVPMEFGLDKAQFALKFPVSPSEEDQDFALGMKFAGLTVSELIWAMLDGQNKLPHDPATIGFDLTGKALLNEPLLDEKALASSEAPGEIRQLSIKDLIVDAVGAKLTGFGDFTFDNTDMTTFDGFPRPEGALNLTLKGGNTLLDRLVEMGILPEEQAMGARMMLGLFAVAGAGEDTLNSTIEVNYKGHVLANGQRLK